MHNHLTFDIWDEQAFRENRQQWQQLLDKSLADPLFLSWQWQYAWWKNCICQKPRLQIIAVYEQDQLVALAPLFSHERRLKKVFTIRQLQFIGCSYDILDAQRSDNLDFIVDAGADLNAIDQMMQRAIKSLNWHNFLVQSAGRKSHVFRQLRRFKNSDSLEFLSRGSNYIVDFGGDFDRFCKQLKKKVRQKTILHRRFIQDEPGFAAVDFQDMDSFIHELNRLKVSRWHKKAYEDQRLKFLQMFTGLCRQSDNMSLLSSTLVMDNKAQSAFLGFVCDNRGYFVQYAFDPAYNPKLSLGFLHLGYVIEAGYRQGLQQLQLLPGGGRSVPYKQYLASKIEPQLTVRIISSPWLKGLHWLLRK